MANTIAKATGGDATREKTTTRLGSRYASAQANTWRTFATVTTWADGRVTVSIERDHKRIAALAIRCEAETDAGESPLAIKNGWAYCPNCNAQLPWGKSGKAGNTSPFDGAPLADPGEVARYLPCSTCEPSYYL